MALYFKWKCIIYSRKFFSQNEKRLIHRLRQTWICWRNSNENGQFCHAINCECWMVATLAGTLEKVSERTRILFLFVSISSHSWFSSGLAYALRWFVRFRECNWSKSQMHNLLTFSTALHWQQDLKELAFKKWRLFQAINRIQSGKALEGDTNVSDLKYLTNAS